MPFARILKVAALLAAGSWGSLAAAFPTPLTTVRVYPPNASPTALFRPLFVASPPGDNTRLFIVEQRTGSVLPNNAIGRIRILNIFDDYTLNTLNGTAFLTTSGQNTGNEEGLLGFAFHPDFFAAPGNVNRGAFFIYLTTGGNNHVIRYTTTGQDPNAGTADPASAQTVIDFSHPGQTNHNGGWIGFGPDGYLYIATGDGGSFCDPNGNAQNINSYLGKMHRIDVSADQAPGNAALWGYAMPPDNPFVGVAGLDEIWHYGLRNPWRCSFDRLTGNLYIGDVGQNFREEISYAAAGVGGLNYGWDIREGFGCSNQPSSNCPSTCDTTGKTDPIWDYPWSSFGGSAVTGGYVYRGSRIPDLQGTYFFAEYIADTISSFRYVGVPLTPADVTNRTAELAPTGPVGGLSIFSIASFGEDAAGELYIVDQDGGEIFKIVVNCAGSILSFVDHPDSATVPACDPVTFSVILTGVRGAVTHVWRKDFIPVPGAPDAPSFTIPAVLPSMAGFYDVVVTDQCGSISSAAGLLTVSPAVFPAGDIEGDCDVDLVDLDLFVNVLLGVDLDPGHVSRSDLNNDTFEDALDIQGMVQAQVP